MKTFGNAARNWTVAEIQGLYGPFTFTERLLQKIWLRGEYDAHHALTQNGQLLRVLHPGRWNLLGGPDFRNARLRFGDAEVTGDVELHLHAVDWTAHAHAADRAYDRVVLHVVLFPPAAGEQARQNDGTPIPTVVLLPLLLHDLEEYAAEDAVEALASRADWRATEELARLPSVEVRGALLAHAEQRWRQKTLFAQRRVERLGWCEACHHAVLEILGYRFNRVPMLKIAARMPLKEWTGGVIDISAVVATEATAWSLQGVRPANQPRVRLAQYAAWARAQPEWPAHLAALVGGFPTLPGEDRDWSTRHVRECLGLTQLRQRLAREIASTSIAGTRFDNVICDGLLPLLAAHSKRELFPFWFHWFAGDLPPRIAAVLKSLGVFQGRTLPVCHGFAQGLLGWMLARERETASPNSA